MKVLTLNFLTCAVKTCKSSSDSFPLHPKDAELVSDDVELNPQLLVNLLPRIDWNALRTTSREVWFYCFNFLHGVGIIPPWFAPSSCFFFSFLSSLLLR